MFVSAPRGYAVSALYKRIEGTAEQIDALNTAVTIAVFSAQQEVANSRREVQKCASDLARAVTASDRSFHCNMLSKWQVHLQRDQEELAKARAALEFMIIAQITRIEEQS